MNYFWTVFYFTASLDNLQSMYLTTVSELAYIHSSEQLQRVLSQCFFHSFGIPDRIGIGSVGFCVGRETGEPGEKPSEQGMNHQQNVTHI